MITITCNSVKFDYKTFTFPGGEVGFKFNMQQYALWLWAKEGAKVTITARVHTGEHFMLLAMIKNALESNGATNIELVLPYVSYGRQDRICDAGEAFSLKVYANLLNSLNFKSVKIYDPHSEATALLINNVQVITQLGIIQSFDAFAKRILKGVTFVAPDAGGNKKTAAIASYFGHGDYVRADKLRDLTNGNIKETIVYCDDLNGADVVIVDDICDGGRTFVELAKALKKKNAGKIILYVTHGIFSKGVDVLFNDGIDEIYTTNSYNEVYDPRVVVFRNV